MRIKEERIQENLAKGKNNAGISSWLSIKDIKNIKIYENLYKLG